MKLYFLTGMCAKAKGKGMTEGVSVERKWMKECLCRAVPEVGDQRKPTVGMGVIGVICDELIL